MSRTRSVLLGLLLTFCVSTSSVHAALLFNTNSTWNLLKGRAEASTPDNMAWTQLSFNDSTWTAAASPFWYDVSGDSSTQVGGTVLSDMQNQYTTIYLRRTVVITDLSQISGLRLGYLCDDAFVVWVNGVELYRYNAPVGLLPFTASATGAVTEPIQYTTIDLTTTSMLVTGTNIIAVQGLNAGAASSDFDLNLSLSTIAPDLVPPTVATVTPSAGTIPSLTSLTVVFSEPVAGVDASDLLINGVPATGLSGGNDTFTFTFPQPAYGTVNVTWSGSAGIADFGVPPNAFNTTGAGATWQYLLKDSIPPTVAFTLPSGGVTIRNLNQIEVDFSEPVQGVDAADLLINGVPATGVTAGSATQYLFTFPAAAPGTVQVTFAANHNIRDLAATPNAFAGASWSYTVDPNAVLNSVRINEISAANIAGLKDEDNQFEDWVELYNTSASAVSMAGWSLSDDKQTPDRWIFPAVSIPGHGYLIVFCSGKDRKPTAPGSRLHTNFKLGADGEFIGLYNSEVPRQLVSSFDPYPNQRSNYSFGYDPQDQLRYFATSTPGGLNGASTIVGVVSDTRFSQKRGFFDTPFSLSITCATPGVSIRYTTNGSAPTEVSGIVYSGPISIAATKVVRAIAYRTGYLSSDVDCQTYLFLDDIIKQPDEVAPAPGWPAQNKTGAGQKFDYGMDPQITTNATWGPLMKDSLKSIPTYSLVMDLNDFNYIYSNPGGDTITYERPGSIELVYPDDSQGYHANCGIRIRGGFSRSTDNPKHAFRIFFRQEYGLSKLAYPVFGPTGAQEFDKFDLRTMQNYSWAFQGDSRMICFRDVSSRDAQLAMGELGTRGNFYHLYVNGAYWGLYNTEERPEAAYAESYIGGNADDYDVIKQLDGYISGATDGNEQAWYRLWQAATNGFASDANYFKVQGLNPDGTPNPAFENLVDVVNMIDYILVINYGGNLDAPISNFLGNDSPNNWYGIRDRTGKHGGFRFVSHDAEHTLLNVNEDRTGIVDLSASGGQYGVINSDWTCGNPLTQSGGAAAAIQRSTPQYIWFRMIQNAEFRMLAADRIQKFCFNGGPLSPEGMRNSLMVRSNEIQLAIVAESARWGDAKVGTPFTRDTWKSALATVITTFVPGRSAVVVSQMKADGVFPNINAPLFNSYGGIVSNGFSLFMTNNNGLGTIYYTIDGSDPRLRGGAIAPTAIAYAPGTPVAINFPTTIKARVLSGTTWSAVVESIYYPGQDFGNLRVTEIMYNPLAQGPYIGDDLEFVELKNAGTTLIDVGGLTFTDGITFTFTNRTRLQPGQFFVLGRNPAALAARYPGLIVNGTYTGRLDNGGEALTLSGPLGNKIFSFDYKDSGRWPVAADGFGFSLVPRTGAGLANPGNPGYWRASTNPGGSPGTDDPEPTIPGIVINEALTHSDPLVDYVELYNPTGASVDISGWFLTDDANLPTKFRIPNGTSIPAGGYRVFTENDFNPTPGTNNSFTLDSHGEEIYLLSGSPGATNLTGYSHGFTFGAAENGVTFGRHVISTGEELFVAQKSGTPNAANSGPRVGPVVIRQIMYHPADLPNGFDNTADEYVELRNITTSPVALYDLAAPTNHWRIRGGIGFDFPANFILNATQSVLITSFSPSDATAVAAFRAKFGTFTGVQLLGPYTGKLNNSSDTVELQKPDAPDTNSVPYVTVDQVDYGDSAPWPPSADGGGAALRRIALDQFGNDPANWIGSAPLTIVSVTPATISVRPGTTVPTNVTFTVNAYGTGNLTYQWRKDGVAIPGATGDTFTVVDVQLDEDGTYSVDVTDASGTARSGGATLFVLINPLVVQAPLSQTVVAGRPVTLSTEVTGNPGPFTYEWRLGSVGQQTNISMEKINFYSFMAPNMSTTLVYRVVVKNPANPNPGVSHSPVTTITVMADSDGDGIPDDWETAAGLNPNNPLDANGDLDGDGVSNAAEYLAGTDPKDPQSYLKIDQITGLPATLTFSAVSNKTYTIQFKDDLNAAWHRLADVVARTNSRIATVIDPSTNSARVYRLTTPRVP